jgi:hypothetical protein
MKRFISIFAITFFFFAYAFSQVGWLFNWNYRKPIKISNTGSSALTNYQILVNTDTAILISAGKMKSYGEDIRFTDSDGFTLLNYWIESGINTASTKIWIKVPSIPASSTKTIYMYYGNPDATSVSSIDGTMDEGLRYFYYDGINFGTFKGTDIDTYTSHDWGNDTVSIKGNTWEDQKDTLSIRWEGWVKNKGSGSHTFYVTTDDGSRLYVGGSIIIDKWFNQSATEYNANYLFSSPVPIKYEWYENTGNAVAKLGWAPADGSGKVYPIPSTYLRNRKYTSPEPTVSVGAEEFSFLFFSLFE